MTEGRLDYTRRDFSSLMDAVLAYVKRYIPSISDTTRWNPGIRFLRLLAGVVDVLLRYLDLAFNERSWQNAKQLRSMIANSEVINYKLDGPAGAEGSVTFTQTGGGAGAIPQWQALRTAVSPVRNYVTTEGAAAPGLGLAVDLDVVQGVRVTGEILAGAADGSNNQSYALARRRPVKAYTTVYVNGGAWTRVNDLLTSGPNDQVFEMNFDENMYGAIKFGDNENGVVPTLGSIITVDYVSTDGVIGEVGAGVITVPVGLAGYSVVNALGTSGASDGDTVDSIRHNAPKQAAALQRAVIGEDFEALASEVAQVYSAKAAYQTGNLITLRVVPVGGGSPSQSLLDAVYNALEPLMMEGTALTVEGFELVTLWVECRVKLRSRGVSRADAEAAIRDAVNELLAYTEIEIGKAWAPSDFHALIEALDDGNLVDFVDTSLFTRSPRIVANGFASLTLGGMNILANCGYADWAVYRRNAYTFSVYKNGSYKSDGHVGIAWVSPGNEISFTLGSAAHTAIANAVAGQCTDPGGGLDNLFTDAGALFGAVAPGDVLTITGGANAGTYIVATIPAANQLTVTTPFPTVGTAGEVWAVTRGDVIPSGAVWEFSTSKAVGPVKIGDDELVQDFEGREIYFDITILYPDEWTY